MTFLELLKEKDMTQARLARKLRVSKQAVHNWVKGENQPKDFTVFIDIAKALEVEPQFLVEVFKNTKSKKKER